VIFDADTIQDQAKFGDPHHYATGVRDVWVNGTHVLVDGVMPGVRPGTALRHE
jgi:N-acyl-D-amino-acid deacylase